jgi:hypothetical protein
MLAHVKQAKVLGLTLDEFLIWTKHIDNLCSAMIIVDLPYYAVTYLLLCPQFYRWFLT